MSSVDESGIWEPTADVIAHSQATALAEELGVPDYDALLRHSVQDPAAYWERALSFLGIDWSKKPDSYIDLSQGKEFPRWFPGGELNWVDTVLKFGDQPASAERFAIVAERESGAVTHLTYADLSQRVRALAAAFHGQGVRRGDRIGLFSENGAEATITVLAVAYLGAVVVPLFSGFGSDAIVSRLNSCGARGLVASSGFDRRGRRVDLTPTVREIADNVPSMDLLVVKDSEDSSTSNGGLNWYSLIDGSFDTVPSARMTADDPFMVIYTSGTTGKPKGAVHTHGSFPLKIAHDAAMHFDIGAGDVLCWPADMGWVAGPLVLSSALLRGATLVCYDGAPDFPDWSRISQLVARHRITHLGSAPTLIRGLAAHPQEATAGDLSTIKLLITAGEGIDSDHFMWFQRHFGGGTQPLINYTGGTEVSGALLSSVVVRPIAPAAFNTPSPGVDVRVVDAAGNQVTDEIGELAIGAPFLGMTHSFWEDDERYLDTYWRTVPGMWIHGDLAMQRAQDDFVVLGRSDDTIKVAGKRLGPAEVESLLTELPDIIEAAAIGVPDSVKGQQIVVFVVAAPAWDGDEADLAEVVSERVTASLGKAFRPAVVHFVASLPKTRSTKVMRRVIRNIYCNQPLGDLSALDNPAALNQIRTAIRP